MAAHTVLLVEDHRDIAEMVAEYLTGQGYATQHVVNGALALEKIDDEHFDAVILDIMLPGIDGLQTCQRIRQTSQRDIPIIMLTARDTLDDKLAGFEQGADDYLVKPFDVQELEARLRALIARSNRELSTKKLQISDLILDLSTMRIERGGQAISLTPIGFRILHLLIQHSPHVVPRRNIEREIWGDLPPDSDALRSHMYNLRKAIDKPFPTRLIHTVHNTGFRLTDEQPDK